MQLIWDGQADTGRRAAELKAVLRSPPAGVVSSSSFVQASTRSRWALVTWAVSAVMIFFGLATNNWYLLALSPFMISAAIMQSWGKVRASVCGDQVVLFEGAGGIGKRQRMALAGIQGVEYVVKRGRGGATGWLVVRGAEGEVKFGRHLNEAQMEFVIAFLMESGSR